MTDTNMTAVYPGLPAIRGFLIKHWASYADEGCS